MVGRILFLVLVVSVVRAWDYYNGNRFFCDNEDQIREVQNAKDTLKRLIQRRGWIYLMFENRILYTRVPDSWLITDLNRPVLLQNNIFEIPVKEQALAELGIPDGYRVMGYVHDEKQNALIELYSTEGERGVGENEILGFAFRMSFNSTAPPGTRARRIKLNEMWTYFWLNNPVKKYMAKDLLTYSGPTKYIEIYDGNLHVNGHNFFVTYSYRYLDLELCYTFWNRPETAFCRKFENQEYKWMKSFLSYLAKIWVDALKGEIWFDWFVFGVEEDHAINFIHYRFRSSDFTAQTMYYNITKHLNIRWSFDDMLSCHTPWTDRRQLKGVYYHKRSKIFYVFVKRFYLKIQDELVQNSFELDNSVYATNAYDIVYENDEMYDKMRFDMMSTKFIKHFPTEVYYMPYWYIYGMSLDDQDLVKIKQLIGKDAYRMKFHECPDLILVVNKVFVYCFQSSRYIFLYEMDKLHTQMEDKKRFFTHKIFEDLNIGYFSNQSLEFTFNYGVNQVAFLTTTDLWLFEYDGFNREPDDSLTYTEKHVRLRNCFFAKCLPMNATESPATTESTTKATTRKKITKPRPHFTTPSGPASQQTTPHKPSKKRLSDLYLFLIIFGVLFLIAALVYTCYLISKRDSFDEGLSRREVS